MLIGSKYSDNKIYRGIKHYDHMPLTSDDIHEYTDTQYMKNAHLMNNLLGYGTLNTPNISITSSGLSMSEPSVVLVDGDVSLIQSDDNLPIIAKTAITSKGFTSGVVCILGWYQHISVSSTLKNYGGLENSNLTNDLKDNRYPTAISSRYQFRWMPILISSTDSSSSAITLQINDRDQDGTLLDTTSNITSKEKHGHVFIFNAPDNMEYSESDLYLVPIIEYTYNLSNHTITTARAVEKISAGSPFLVSTSEPEGISVDGTQWYNPTTREFKTYVGASGGFVASASKMAFLQYQSIYIVETATSTPQDINIPVGVSSFQEGDILRVIYEGLELAKTLNYTIDYENSTIKLLNFTTNVGDTIYFTVTRVVEATDITNITSTFVNHLESTGSSTVEAHVKLSDTPSSTNDTSKGIAATPKLVSVAMNTLKSELSTDISTLEDEVSEDISSINDDLDLLRLNSSNLQTAISGLSTSISTIEGQIDDLESDLESSNLIKDSTTNKYYKFGINNGLLYLEEV